MMKKRIVSLGLAAMMTAGLFTGCEIVLKARGTPPLQAVKAMISLL